ncbi:MerR family transcriptional regulator [Micromonospora sp. WMMD1155]|uniref:MerR family transcriptional regulator n=1 Tax=Micromonospora sp. WMMD1155 TaxID=3016094 RepID=UPI00249A46AC|nr:MerR family transcriptional regulator [Micromonospora sp. WMMD1155]WFE51244.1 MerR family transcriptional regulator [Micromonospora sp. WMMD1155]
MRELARITHTKVSTVRHYHKVGLLAEPERAANGYKRYGVSHLIRLLQVKRLSELGISLPQIAAMDGAGAGGLAEIRALHAELEVTIEHLTRIRSELAQVLDHDAPAVTPRGFAALSAQLSSTQRLLLSVYAAVFDEPTLEAFRQVLYRREETDVELDRLPATADDGTVEDLARRMVPVTVRLRGEYPQLNNPLQSSPLGATAAGLTMAHALVELYNPAQLRVLKRLDTLLQQHDAKRPPDRP